MGGGAGSGCDRPGWRPALALAVIAAALLVVAFVLLEAAPGVGDRLMNASSTDWPTLRRDPVLPWITSAVWVSEGTEALVFWVVVVPTTLAFLARRVGVGRALLIAATAHVLGSLGSEGLLGIRYLTGGVSHRALYLLDVGPSYVAVGTVAGLVVVEHGRRRLTASVVLVALLGLPQIGLLDGLGSLQVTPVGHVLATVFGAASALVVGRGRPAGPTDPPVVLATPPPAPPRVNAPAGPRGSGRPGRSR
jgi:hypothetical protein